MRTISGTHTNVKFSSRRKLVNFVLKALNDITGANNGTLNNPYELASSEMRDRRTLIKTIYQDGFVRYNDGFYIVEVDEYMGEGDYMVYVDVTTQAIKELRKDGIVYKMNSEIE